MYDIIPLMDHSYHPATLGQRHSMGSPDTLECGRAPAKAWPACYPELAQHQSLSMAQVSSPTPASRQSQGITHVTPVGIIWHTILKTPCQYIGNLPQHCCMLTSQVILPPGAIHGEARQL